MSAMPADGFFKEMEAEQKTMDGKGMEAEQKTMDGKDMEERADRIPMDREEKRTYDFERIEALIGDGGGLVKTGDILALGIDYRRILQFVEAGLLTRVRNGYYSLGGGACSEAELVAAMFPDGVLTMESALYAHGYIATPPAAWSVAVSKNTSKSRFRLTYPVLIPYYSTDEVLTMGVEEREVDGVVMKVYSIDRLICDVLRYEEKLDHRDFVAAVRGYIDDPEKDAEQLADFAAKRKVSRKVHDMIGVWL